MRLLHVEDDRGDAELVARVLRRSVKDLRVDLVPTLRAAREHLVNAARYDAALVDLQLPDGSGLDLLTEIRNRQLQLPVVLLTGSGDEQAAVAALQSGADDYLPKSTESYARLANSIAIARQRFAAHRRIRNRSLEVLYVAHDANEIELTRRHLARHAPYIHLTVVPDVVIALSHLPLDDSSACEFDIVLFDYRQSRLEALDAERLHVTRVCSSWRNAGFR